MDQVVKPEAPYFNSSDFREELTELARRYARDDGQLRCHVLDSMKSLVDAAKETAYDALIKDRNGRKCANGLSTFQDEFIRVLYDFTIHHVYRAQNPSSAERMAIVATGGYGRELLAPGSDIDLLFLLPYKQTAWGESVIEYMLYLLWDLGFKVGHATRTVDQCIRLSNSDMTIRTALLDARLIWGEKSLFEDFSSRFQREIVQGTNKQFIDAKLEERDVRHSRAGASRYLVEPNIKDGKGGLRDLHTLEWLGKYLFEVDSSGFVSAGVFSPQEYHTFRKCEDFLWTIRCALHFLTGRAEERLSFEYQQEMAEFLGYTDHGGLRAVERFMKHYFLVAKDVGDLTRIVCSALEIKQLKSLPKLSRLLAPLRGAIRTKLEGGRGFKLENGRLNAEQTDIFKEDPLNLLRLFSVAEKNNVPFHPEVLRLVRASLRLIDKEFRSNPEANRMFLEILTSKSNPETILRKMNEAGVLGRFIPAFGRIVSMMQFNMYHHFTVDEHLIRSVGILNDLEKGGGADDHPLSTSIFHTVRQRRALYVAMFLHDIAKGRDEDHSLAGARLSRRLGKRFGLSAAEIETVSWLIEKHLVMSQFAQSRDINDAKTISDFAEIVKSPDRLKMLLILTVADIRAVGPGVWNGWKGQLLRALYFQTEPIVAGGDMGSSEGEEIERARHALANELKSWSQDALETLFERHYSSYWLRTDLAQQVEHAQLLAEAETSGLSLATRVSSDEFRGVTLLTILAPNHPHILSSIAGACASAGANIVDAQISTTRDGIVLDTIFIQREFERDEDEERRARRICRTIEEVLQGKKYLDTLLKEKLKPSGRVLAFDVEPEVMIDNNLSNQLTVIEVRGLDRPGLLYELTSTLGQLNLDISSAHIVTFGEKAVDVFYVTDLTGNKIVSKERIDAIRNALFEVLDVNHADEMD